MVARLLVEVAFIVSLAAVMVILHRMERDVPASDCRANGVIVQGRSAAIGAALMVTPPLVLFIGGHAIGAFR